MHAIRAGYKCIPSIGNKITIGHQLRTSILPIIIECISEGEGHHRKIITVPHNIGRMVKSRMQCNAPLILRIGWYLYDPKYITVLPAYDVQLLVRHTAELTKTFNLLCLFLSISNVFSAHTE